MRIGLASDTFGNVDGLVRALETFERAGAERIFFLGGRSADLDQALARRRAGGGPRPLGSDLEFLAAVEGELSRRPDPLADRVVRVASRDCPARAAGAPGLAVDLLEGRICCLVHDKAELTRDDIANASLLFHGNSERPGLVQIGPRCFVTPGHLRAPAPGRSPGTFALAELAASELVLTTFSAEGVELGKQAVSLGGAGKVSVR
ncbi:MAG TPA: hypothetical protein VML50_05535 [Anaeromyxobacter sp.]|nr:hypothetical protein [Anaeromyxobacter sp.]